MDILNCTGTEALEVQAPGIADILNYLGTEVLEVRSTGAGNRECFQLTSWFVGNTSPWPPPARGGIFLFLTESKVVIEKNSSFRRIEESY